MITRAATTLLALAGIAGCATFAGGAHSLDPSQLSNEPGWLVAGPTPELHQRDAQECGATSLAMVAGRWRVSLSPDQAVAALPAAAPRGTRLGDLLDVARANGLRAFAVAGDRDTLVHELRAGRPVIVELAAPAGLAPAPNQYAVIVAVHPIDDQFVLLDPGSGLRVRSWTDLDAAWRPAGRPTLIVLGPAAT